jgi:fatty acyl-CoA reductase
MIAESLADKRVGVTGATGFLGTAIVERLMRCVPGCQVVALVRPSRRQDATARLRRDVLANDAFDRLRSELGDRFDSEMSARLSAVGGDVSRDGLGLDEADAARWDACDIVIHSAATVSFDSPLDAAIEVNLLGSSRVWESMARSGRAKHLVAVSTAYVAGSRRGPVPEAPRHETSMAVDVPFGPEVDAARRTRSDVEAASRQPAKLAWFHRQARHAIGAAGSPLLAERTERNRQEWVDQQMVEAGRARAQSLGWPDAYAYSKALGEQALLSHHGPVEVSIVRPSIIESALEQPRPGWIRGFRMAEPVIISYGRGLLAAFPGLPEGIVDVIPVDLVVAAILAVAARGPDPAGPAVYHVASGDRNPLRYGRLVELVREYFTANPLYDADGQPILVPKWTFPGRGRVQRRLEQVTQALATGEKVVSTLPVRGRRAEVAGALEERRQQATRALGYTQLYGAYAESEALFRLDRLMDLYGSLSEADQRSFCFDPGVIDWDHYVSSIHMPSIVAHARVRTGPGRRLLGSRADRGRDAVLARERHLAAFDLENTLIASNVVESYAWLATRHMDLADRVAFAVSLMREAPSLLRLDRRDRGDFLRYFYRRYEGAPAKQLRHDAWELLSDMLITKSFPAGIRRVREHRALGHRTVLITGALDFVIEPLAPLFDDIVCARPETYQGSFTGHLLVTPPTGEARAGILEDYATAHGLRLSEAVAYADSSSDLPMLEAVGFPVAVNPEPKLAAVARKRGWHIEHWDRAPGGPRKLLPMPPLPHHRGEMSRPR